MHYYRASQWVTTPQGSFLRCKYPRWAFNKIPNKFTNNNREGDGNNNTQVDNSTTQANNNSGDSCEDRPPRGRPNIGHSHPLCSGPGESIKNACTKYGIQIHFKGNKTFRQVLVKLKDQDQKEKKSGVIYCYQCGAIDCGEEYIGRTSRTLGEHYREHLKEPSPIHVHSQHTGHQLNPDQFNIMGREDQDLSRLIKESIYIRVNNPTLKRNIGKFNLSHIWNRFLFSTPNLKTAFA